MVLAAQRQRPRIVGRKLLIGTGGYSGTIGLEALQSGAPAQNAAAPPTGAHARVHARQEAAGGGARQGFKVGVQPVPHEVPPERAARKPNQGRADHPQVPGAADRKSSCFIAADGDFKLTASSSPPHDFVVADVFTSGPAEVSVGKDDDRVYLETNGELSFENNNLLKNLLKTPIRHREVPDQLRRQLRTRRRHDPAAVERDDQGRTGQDRDHRAPFRRPRAGPSGRVAQISLSGASTAAVSVNPGGVDCRGDGIKFYFTVDGQRVPLLPRGSRGSESTSSSRATRVERPGRAHPQRLSVAQEPEYLGSISFSLPKVKIAGGGTMKYNTAYPAWGVDVWLELPMPILVGSTGLGIYGFRGLVRPALHRLEEGDQPRRWPRMRAGAITTGRRNRKRGSISTS